MFDCHLGADQTAEKFISVHHRANGKIVVWEFLYVHLMISKIYGIEVVVPDNFEDLLDKSQIG